jgi:hypothetical protein
MTVLFNKDLNLLIRRNLTLLCSCIIVLALQPAAAHAASGSGALAFSQGSARLGIRAGGATAFGQNYSVVGIEGGYFVADGVEAGLDAESWFGNSPKITQVSPQMRFVLNTSSDFNPYIGGFYRRTFIADHQDTNSVGARAGLFYTAGRNMFFGGGVVYETHLSCDRTVYSSCSETYPELSITFLFR